ncbi:MAG: NlpC/P60 family protein [Apilactobacillus sp.]|uniref:C40 family peptidase n=1 Tax=Apilactobacillus TaxID=2767877 RepID=UPI0025E9E492|nr:NlpC/P60 family protein [Apilactobacillus sp.]MCT6823097.1 NlpC/P60 family protein [Apilactobacillus sp.]MCT6858298.1 NlpC/P60 family protein [Apilactobacillus sp.]
MNKTTIKILISLTMTVAMAFVMLFPANETTASANSSKYVSIYNVANSKLGTRYVYGSTGPSSFDCSGFVRYIFKHGANKNLARTAQAQYNTTKKISKKQLKKGDLVFIGASTKSIYHVGMYIGNGEMIDAQNRGVVKESIHAPWWHVVGYTRAI